MTPDDIGLLTAGLGAGICATRGYDWARHRAALKRIRRNVLREAAFERVRAAYLSGAGLQAERVAKAIDNLENRRIGGNPFDAGVTKPGTGKDAPHVCSFGDRCTLVLREKRLTEEARVRREERGRA